MFQLQRMVANLQRLNDDSIEILKNLQGHFPVEIELNRVSGVVTTTADDAEYEDDDIDDEEDLVNDDDAISIPDQREKGKDIHLQEELLLDLR